MIHVELPHVNVLSKIDLVEQYGKLGNLVITAVDIEDNTWLHGDMKFIFECLTQYLMSECSEQVTH